MIEFLSTFLVFPGFFFWVALVLCAVVTVAVVSHRSYHAWWEFLIGGFVILNLFHFGGNYLLLDWAYHPSPVPGIFGLVGWTIVILGFLAASVSVRYETGVWAAISLIGVILGIQWFTGIDVFGYIQHNKLMSVVWGAGYFVVGGMWGLLKWQRHVSRQFDRYTEFRTNWLQENNLQNDLGLEEKQRWTDYFNRYGGSIEFRPQFRRHKNELLAWFAVWPVSILETFLFDFIIEVWEWIYHRLGRAFEAIMAYQWRGTENDLMTPEERRQLEELQAQQEKVN